MIKDPLVVKRKVSGVLGRQIIHIRSFKLSWTSIIVGLPASRVVLISEDDLGHGDIFLNRNRVGVSQVVELDHFVFEILREDIHPWH